MIIKILECQNCKKKHIFDEYEAVYNHQVAGSEYDDDFKPGIKMPYRLLICPSCKHANYTDNVNGILKITCVNIPNKRIRDQMKEYLI